MKKKGFVFIETIVVLMIVTLSLTLLIASYTLISTKSKEKQYYDKISDKYLLYAFSNLGTSSSYNYSLLVDESKSEVGAYKIEPYACSTPCDAATQTEQDKIFCNIFKKFTNAEGNENYSTTITTSNYSKVNTTDENCTVVLNELNIKYIYIVNDVAKALSHEDATSVFDNGVIEYMKTLRKCYDDIYVTGEDTDLDGIVDSDITASTNPTNTCTNPIQYMIGVFYRNGDYYFASIEL